MSCASMTFNLPYEEQSYANYSSNDCDVVKYEFNGDIAFPRSCYTLSSTTSPTVSFTYNTTMSPGEGYTCKSSCGSGINAESLCSGS